MLMVADASLPTSVPSELLCYHESWSEMFSSPQVRAIEGLDSR